MTLKHELLKIAQDAQTAVRRMIALPSTQKDEILKDMAKRLSLSKDAILRANIKDLSLAKTSGLKSALI
ncbi:MAG: hypothetical protein WC417_00540 [Candidatus Omnitrophota bacterium]|jgi:gamma-glutamyl phosphate reductase